MKKIQKSSELLWIFGIIFVAMGVAICNKADLGVSMIAAPAFVISEAMSSICPGFTVGVTEYVLEGSLIAIMCIIVRRFRWRYLLAFVVAMLYGYAMDLFIWVFRSDIPFDTVAVRWIMLIVGNIVTGFGVACFFRTFMPLLGYELFVAEVTERYKFKLTVVKWIFDVSLLALSLILAFTLFGDVTSFDWSTIGYASFHSIGLGTIVTTLINSPLIGLMGKLIDKLFDPTPMFPKLKRILKGN